MAPIRNGAVIYKSVPETYPVVGEHLDYDSSQTIDLADVPLNGGTLVKALYFSIDPYMRGRMRDPKKWSYNKAFELGKP
jgi:NADPH-dependent curcumin reductase CurA